jgi:putative DNA primase/helicase
VPMTIELRQEAIDRLYTQLRGQQASVKIAAESLINGAGPSPDTTDDIILQKALGAQNGQKFMRLWAGEHNGYASQSEADLAFCRLLAFFTQDAAQIDRLFRRSGLMREKWERPDYCDLTISRAIESTHEYWRGASVASRNGHLHDGAHHPQDEPSHPSEDHKGPTESLDDIHLTDVGNGLRLVRQFGEDLRYVITWKKWLLWRDGRWMLDEGAAVEWHAKQVIAGLYRWAQEKIGELAQDIPDDELKEARAKALAQAKAILNWAHTSENGSHIDLMVKRARVNPKVQIRHDQLDADPMLFHVINGTIDLRTGELRSPQRSDLITKRSPVVYDADAICPRWQTFLQRIQGFPRLQDPLSDDERGRRIERADRMITYLKRLVGMSLTADVMEQILVFLHGGGQNGKSTFLNLILALTGEYGMQAAPNFLLVREHEQHPTELTDLFGKRFVSTVEIEKGKQLAEALMKILTGSEKVRARRMREDFWEFFPTWKVWLAANDKPKVKGRDKATWRRIKLIPFDVTIPDDEVDHDLPQKLMQELPGILNWAIEGCLEWQRYGLQEPPEVTRATEAYRDETDILGQFTRECCTTGKDQKTQSAFLHKAFDAYTGQPISAVEFADVMKASGYKKKTIDGRVYWVGIGLRSSTADLRQKAANEKND